MAMGARRAWLGVLAALLAGSSQALTTREQVLSWCTRTSQVAAAGRCLGYLLAVEDALASGPVEGVRACLPSDIGLPEQHSIVVDWLLANPQAAAASAAGLVARAYAARYPCPP